MMPTTKIYDELKESALPPTIMVQRKMTILETKLIFQTPVLHIHEYGRKSNKSSNIQDVGSQYPSPFSELLHKNTVPEPLRRR